MKSEVTPLLPNSAYLYYHYGHCILLTVITMIAKCIIIIIIIIIIIPFAPLRAPHAGPDQVRDVLQGHEVLQIQSRFNPENHLYKGKSF